MTNILGISGSLRRGSYNTALLRAAAGLIEGDAQIEVATLHGIPLYDADIEAGEGLPPAVQELKARIIAADGLLLVTPEYNNGIPGVFKNAIDWLSRPDTDTYRVFGGKPVAVTGASPGNFGTMLAQSHWLPVLRTLKTQPWFGGRLMVSRAGTIFNEASELTDERVRVQLREFVNGFTRFIEKGS